MHVPHLIRSRAERFSGLRTARLRRAAVAGSLAAGVLAACLATAGTIPAQAATASTASAGHAAAATAYQNKVLNAAMARVAGGTRVSADEVEWDGGKIVLGVSAADSSATCATPTAAYGYDFPVSQCLTCESDVFCAWGATSYGGDCWMYISGAASGFWLDWAAYSGGDCGAVGTWSWENETPFRVWKEQGHSGGTEMGVVWDGGTGSGNTLCIDPNGTDPDDTNGTTRTLGWIQMTSNSDNC